MILPLYVCTTCGRHGGLALSFLQTMSRSEYKDGDHKRVYCPDGHGLMYEVQDGDRLAVLPAIVDATRELRERMIQNILSDISLISFIVSMIATWSAHVYIKKRSGRVEHHGPYMTFQTRTDERYELPQASYPQEMIVHKPKVEHYEPSELLLRSIDIYFRNRYGIPEQAGKPTSPETRELPLPGPSSDTHTED